MYEHFSKRLERVVKLAQKIAREYEQEYIGTEHILLAIIQEGTGISAKILTDHNINEKKLRTEIDKLIKASMEETWVFGRLPGSPHFKNVVARSIEAAQKLKSKEVCTEHILLALLAEKGSVAYRALRATGVTAKEIRQDIIQARTQA